MAGLCGRVYGRALLSFLQRPTNVAALRAHLGGSIRSNGGKHDSARLPALEPHLLGHASMHFYLRSSRNAKTVLPWCLLEVCESQPATMVGNKHG